MPGLRHFGRQILAGNMWRPLLLVHRHRAGLRARLDGFRLTIRPLANLERDADSTAWGIVARVTHAELARLYRHAKDVLGGDYLPEEVVVRTREGEDLEALCYIAPALADGPADGAYVGRIAGPARELGFPEEYVRHVESFAPPSSG